MTISDRLAVYVPSRTSHLRSVIRAGSGIVGPMASANGRITVDYEGDIYRPADSRSFADRVATAAGRHVERYPTVARVSAEPADLVRVGVWNDTRGVVIASADGAEHLARWLGTDKVDPATLVASGQKFEAARLLEDAEVSGDPTRIAQARWFAARASIR